MNEIVRKSEGIYPVNLFLIGKQIGISLEKAIQIRDELNTILESNRVQPEVSGILADFENLLIDIMGNRKCSIGSLENYYDLHLEVKRINELYSKIQEYFTVSQNSR